MNSSKANNSPVNPARRLFSASPSQSSTAVYNIEVHGEHAYQVSELGLIVHNECVYQAVDSAGNVLYVGITNNFARRALEHASRFRITKVIDGLSRSDARAVEQSLIRTHGFLRDGGTLLNKITSIAATNPIFGSAMARAKALGF